MTCRHCALYRAECESMHPDDRYVMLQLAEVDRACASERQAATAAASAPSDSAHRDHRDALAVLEYEDRRLATTRSAALMLRGKTA